MPVTVIMEVHAGNRLTVQRTSPAGDPLYEDLTFTEEDLQRAADLLIEGLVENKRSAERSSERRDFADREFEKASLDREGIAPDRRASNDIAKSEATVAEADRNERSAKAADREPVAAEVQSDREDRIETAQREAQRRFDAREEQREDVAEAEADQQDAVKADIKELDDEDPNVKRAEKAEKPGDKATPTASKRTRRIDKK